MKKFAVLALLGTVFAAQATDYTFSGFVSAQGSSQVAYTGTFSIVDPVETSTTTYNSDPKWRGTTSYYDGAQNLTLTFANGAVATAQSMQLQVNDTQVQASSWSVGYSAELWLTSPLVVTPPPVPKGSDDTAALILNMSDVYFSFYGAPSTGNTLPTDLAASFKPGKIGLGVYSTVNGLPTTSIYGVQAFTSNGATVPQWTTPGVSAVPELGSLALGLAGLFGMGGLAIARRKG